MNFKDKFQSKLGKDLLLICIRFDTPQSHFLFLTRRFNKGKNC